MAERHHGEQQHPADSKREFDVARVTRVYADTWEVDAELLFGSHATVRRAKVVSHFLPEVHTPDRQSKVLVGWLDAYQQAPIAIPVHNVIVPEAEKSTHVFWSEHLRYRMRITRDGVLEIRNLTGETLLQIQILEQDGVIRLDTPTTHVVMNDAEKSIEIEAEETITAKCKNAKVEAGENADVEAGGDITAHADGNIDASADGNLKLTAGGNMDLTATGIVTIRGSLVNIN